MRPVYYVATDSKRPDDCIGGHQPDSTGASDLIEGYLVKTITKSHRFSTPPGLHSRARPIKNASIMASNPSSPDKFPNMVHLLPVQVLYETGIR